MLIILLSEFGIIDKRAPCLLMVILVFATEKRCNETLKN
jgi:hypothetical protein